MVSGAPHAVMRSQASEISGYLAETWEKPPILELGGWGIGIRTKIRRIGYDVIGSAGGVENDLDRLRL